METVIIVIHLMVVVALVGVVLLQRSEGGALGMGGGGGGFMSARGAANALKRTTAILAAAFFVTSIALGVIAKLNEKPADILDRIPAQTQQDNTGQGTGGGIFDQLAPQDQQAPSSGGQSEAPSTETPAEPQVPSGQ